uniref:Uncharacterized protein n=1 Tax=Anguilla anguilla TaxID=7936 RepID=A0A0E9WXA5_ANGAN
MPEPTLVYTLSHVTKHSSLFFFPWFTISCPILHLSRELRRTRVSSCPENHNKNKMNGRQRF